jgi:hypothetical protein
MNQPATRLITLIMLLQRQPNQKVAVLARTLGISVRSLHRYFAMPAGFDIQAYLSPNGTPSRPTRYACCSPSRQRLSPATTVPSGKGTTIRVAVPITNG